MNPAPDGPPPEEGDDAEREEKVEAEAVFIRDEDLHPQPLPNPRPSIEGDPDFTDNTALEAAQTLRNAMKGIGTNERKIVAVTNSYSHPQRMAIKAAFHSEYGRNLMKDFKNELGGKFEKMVLGFWMDPGGYDAHLVAEACSGMGTDEDVLTEVICTRTRSQMEAMKIAWPKDKTLVERVQSETDSTFGTSNYCTLLVSILEGSRNPNGPADEESARADAELLNRMLTQESKSDAKAKFVEVFASRSWVQIREINGVFQDIAKKYTMAGAIEEAFGDGNTAKALQTINSFACQPYDFWAKKLRKAMSGMGTDDEQLRRVIISRAEVDLRDIGITFGNRYGDGKTLAKWIKDDCSGDYEKLMLAVCGLD